MEGDTYYLPEWAYVHVLHCITVIGYDDSAKIYTYTDTCGKVCGGGSPLSWELPPPPYHRAFDSTHREERRSRCFLSCHPRRAQR